MKVARSDDDIQTAIRRSLRMLARSADAWDTGEDDDEVPRMALEMRKLVHDSGQSKSLCGQVGIKNMDFLDTAMTDRKGLAWPPILRMTIGGPRSFDAPLDDALQHPFRSNELVGFSEWWDDVMVNDPDPGMTRGDIVLAVANQDGGAHDDPKLSEPYYGVSRANALGWVIVSKEGTFPGDSPIPALMRQIAYELLESIERQHPDLLEDAKPDR